MTLVFDKNSWHYRLIEYVFTSNFFLEVDGIDVQAMETVDMEKDFRIIYKKKPKTVNLCPYCRAIVGAVILFPFIMFWRLFPHKPKPSKTHLQKMKQLQRQTWIIRGAAAALNIGFGIRHLFNYPDVSEIIAGSIQFSVAVFVLTGHLWLPSIIKWIIKKFAFKKKKIMQPSTVKPKKEHKTLKKIADKHDIICPPIFFVDVKSEEEFK